MFIDILNAARIEKLSEKDIVVLNSRKCHVDSGLAEVTVIFLKNSPKNSYNRSKQDSLLEVDIEIYAIDKVSQGTPATLTENLHTKSQSITGGVVYCLHLKKGTLVMLIVNTDLANRLVKGQLGAVSFY